jgi:hypothetical protein
MRSEHDQQPDAGEAGDDGRLPAGSDWPDSGLSRRTLLRTAGAASMVLPAAVAASVAEASGQAGSAVPQGKSPRAQRGKFFNAAELALVDELGEIIIPTDAHSPGARAAGVALEIDRRLAELPALDPESAPAKRLWRAGMKWVQGAARKQAGASAFLQLPLEQRLAVVTDMARDEAKPTTMQARFFVALKEEVARAYYTSQIGIQQELQYKGNSYLQDFVGHEAGTVQIKRPIKPAP